jgi:hypothetical protein
MFVAECFEEAVLQERATEPLAAGTPGSPEASSPKRYVALRDDLTALVTYDRRTLETARAEGLSAHAPGRAD